MKIPKYISELLEHRSEWAIKTGSFIKGWDPSSTIIIYKRSDYCTVDTLRKETEAFVAWCNRQVPDLIEFPPAKAIMIPKHTHHSRQWSVVNVYDPILKHIEALVGQKRKKK